MKKVQMTRVSSKSKSDLEVKNVSNDQLFELVESEFLRQLSNSKNKNKAYIVSS